MGRPTATADRVTRVVTLPVRAVVEPGGASVLDTFRGPWQLVTDLANWAQLELAGRDVRRTPDMGTLPRYDRAAVFGTVPRRFARAEQRRERQDGSVRVTPARTPGEPQVSSLYDLFTRTCPFRAAFDGATVPARDTLKAVEDTWTRHKSFGRFAVLWRGEARPMVFRFPYPWPVAADKGRTLRVWRDDAGRPHASLPLPGGRVVLRLADGREFRRQLRQFDALLADVTRLKQAKVTGRRSGGRLVGADLRLVGSFDRTAAVTGVTARVSTGADCVFRAVVDDDDGNPFVIHADQLRGVMHAYDRWRHRFNRDLKHEKRWPGQKRRRTTRGATAQARMDRMRGRIDSERHQIVRCLVGWLGRQGVADVEYDDSESGYFDWTDPETGRTHRRFDLTALREAVRCNCEDLGISFQHVGGADDADE